MTKDELESEELRKIDIRFILANEESQRFLTRMLIDLQMFSVFNHAEALTLRNYACNLVNTIKEINPKAVAECLLAGYEIENKI